MSLTRLALTSKPVLGWAQPIPWASSHFKMPIQTGRRRGTVVSSLPGEVRCDTADLAALLRMIRSLPPQVSEATSPSPERASKRAKTTHLERSEPAAGLPGGQPRPVCIARERVSLPVQEVQVEVEEVVNRNIGQAVRVSFSKVPAAGHRTTVLFDWHIKLTPRSAPIPPPPDTTSVHGSPSTPRDFGFSFVIPKDALTHSQICALNAVSQQSVQEDYGAIWTSVDLTIRPKGASVELVVDIAVYWNESLGVGGHSISTHPQETLCRSVLSTWYPGPPASRLAPQDFYEAACVPDKDAFDSEVGALQVLQLEARLYPFQRRAVQWLLQREGVEWRRGRGDEASGLHPYTASTPELPFTFERVTDADGGIFYLSQVLGVATRDLSAFRSIQVSQDIRGGILAEEMGLGKTLEVISLMLLHPRPAGPLKVFDPYLGKELPATSATLIVAPSALLDQWISELSRHAPSLKVMYYPGLQKAKKNLNCKITPELLGEHDVVITTFSVLRAEMWLALASDEPTRSTRNSRQHDRPVSPLVQISWWRLCIDEAQTVENWTNNAAKLARLIPRINAWAITGTPVRAAIHNGTSHAMKPLS